MYRPLRSRRCRNSPCDNDAVEIAPRLVAKLRDTFVDKVLVKFVVTVHRIGRVGAKSVARTLPIWRESIELTIVI